MKMGDVRLRLDHSILTATVAPMAEAAVKRAAVTARARARANVSAAGLINTGDLHASMTYEPVPSAPDFPRYAVGSPLDYVKFPEFGTRAHGPVKAKALRFKPKGSKTFVFATWVRGVRPYGFMKQTLDEMRPTDFMR